MKTNREKNTEHDTKEVIRPKTKQYDFTELEAEVRSWFK